MSKILEFGSGQEKSILLGIVVIIVLAGGLIFYPIIQAYLDEKIAEQEIMDKRTELKAEPSKTPQEYYAMFQCSCCGQPIDKGCCGMAKQRKGHVDQLLLDGLEENEIVVEMVKKFGFDVLMDSSQEQEIKEYIKSQAPENPPKIEIVDSKHDLGTISQANGVVSTTFMIKNIGKSDLVIENLDTSCMCTTAKLIYQGQESPEFGMSMHGTNPKNFELKIPPGETVQLKVYYDPNAHGKQKKPEMKVIREVTIISNDPIDFQKKVRIELTQTP